MTEPSPVPPRSTSPAVTLGTGLVLAGRYELHDKVGQGKLGSVYKGLDVQARDRGLPAWVAIKIPHPQLAKNRDFGPRLSREMLTGARLEHPSIARCLEVGQFLDTPFLVNEWVDGVPIDVWFARGQDYQALADVTQEVLEALAFAHQQKVIHGEVKPSNIMIVDGKARLLDFGMAGRLDDQLGPNEAALSGLAYLSPEQVLGARGDERADLYSLGAVLYRLVAGRPPFEGRSASEVLLSIVNDPPVALSRLRAAVPVWLDQLGSRLLSKTPPKRWQSAAEVLAWLRRGRLGGAPQPQPIKYGLLLDREHEVELLGQALKLAQTNTGYSLWVDGPPGTGCTRLLQEARKMAGQLSLRTIVVSAAFDRPMTLDDWFHHPELGSDDLLSKIESLCRNVPLALIVERLDEAEEPVQDLLAQLLELTERQALLLIAQSHSHPPGLRSRFQALASLGGLSRESCARLSEERLWAPPPPDSTQWLYRVTAGNAYFLHLMLEQLEGRHFIIEGGDVSWRAPAERDTPASLEAMLTRLLEAEGKETAEILAFGACLGEQFELNLLQAMVLQEAAALESALDALVRSGWLETRWDQGILAYRFTHPCRWRAARNSLADRRARRVHLLASAFLERTEPVDYQRMGWHAQQGQEHERALRAYTACMRRAVEQEHWNEARYWMRRCQRCAQHTHEKLRADRIFPAPWSNFGWAGQAPSTGCHHFLAAQQILLGQIEEATWQLAVAREEGLEEDARRLVENHLLWVALHFRGPGLSPQEVREHLDTAREMAEAHELDEMLALVSAFELRL